MNPETRIRCNRRRRAGILIAGALLATSAAGQADKPGNGLYPATPLPGGQVDERGYQLYSRLSFSPSGIQYPLVIERDYLERETGSGEEQPGWVIGGLLELGWLLNAGTTDTASFREFADFSQAPMVGRFAFRAMAPDSGERVSLIGASPGRDDQYFQLEYRRPGNFRIGAWYNQIPHVFSTNAQVLWEGAGSGQLTLPDDLVPGENSPEQVRNALRARPESTLKLERRRAGLFGAIQAAEHLELFFNAGTERRDGERPFGGTFAYPTLGQVAETIEPIDYVTHEIEAGLRFSSKRLHANLAYNGSFFINDTDSLVWENPGLSLFQPPFVVERGRTALPPDNRFHQVKTDIAIVLPVMRGRWTTSLAYNRKRQDDDLLPPTISSGVASLNGTPVDLDLWNTVAALSRTSAGARIRTALVQSEISLQPASRLRTAFEFRLVDERNDTDFPSFNPITGEFGRIPVDGGIVFDDGIFQPGVPGELIRIRNQPHATDELRFQAKADYRLTGRTTIAATASLHEKQFSHRQRDETTDRRIRLQVTDRSGPWASFRAAGEFARRSGDEYDPKPLAGFLSSALDGFVPLFSAGRQPLELADHREFDLASRDQWLADWQLRFRPGERSDIALSGRFVHDDFDAGFGAEAQSRLSANVEWSYRFARDGSAYVYYSFQDHHRDARGINDAGARAADGSAGGPVFPLANRWRQNLDETNHAAGLGLTHQWGRFLFEADYTFGYARTRRGFEFASSAALAGATVPDDAGDDLPGQRFEHHLFNASVRFPLRRRIGARLFYRLESEHVADPAFAGLDDPILDNQLFLLATPEDFTAHVFGIFVEIETP